jgi:hypothetical protein
LFVNRFAVGTNSPTYYNLFSTAFSIFLDHLKTVGFRLLDAVSFGFRLLDAVSFGSRLLDAVSFGSRLLDIVSFGFRLLDTVSFGLRLLDIVSFGQWLLGVVKFSKIYVIGNRFCFYGSVYDGLDESLIFGKRDMTIVSMTSCDDLLKSGHIPIGFHYMHVAHAFEVDTFGRRGGNQYYAD